MTSGSLPARALRVDRRSSLPFFMTMAAVCLIQLGLSIWRTRSAYFILDDFLNFIIYRDMGLTRHYLLRDLFGHVTPLYRLVQALYFSTFGLHFEMARFIILLVALIPTSMLMLTGRRLQVPLPVSVAGALAIGFLPQLGQAECWWSNALLVVPGFAALFTTLWLLVGRSGEGPDGGEAALAGLVFAVGLGFYDKDLFGVALLMAVAVMVRMRNYPFWAASLRAIFDLRYVLGSALAWSIALLVLREPSPPAPSLGVALGFIWIAWNDAALGALFGMGSSGFQFHSPWLGSVFAHALLIAMVAFTLRRGGMSVAALWAGVFVYIAVTLIVTARMRAGPFGAAFGSTLRYAVEPAAFMITAFVIGCSRTASKSSWFPAAFLVAIAAVTVTGVSIPSIGAPAATRRFVTNVRQSIATYGHTPGVVILDEPLPDHIMAGWMAPFNVPSRFISLFGRSSFSYGGASTADWKLDASGVLVHLSRK